MIAVKKACLSKYTMREFSLERSVIDHEAFDAPTYLANDKERARHGGVLGDLEYTLAAI